MSLTQPQMNGQSTTSADATQQSPLLQQLLSNALLKQGGNGGMGGSGAMTGMLGNNNPLQSGGLLSQLFGGGQNGLNGTFSNLPDDTFNS